jgi:hypothetical protein
MLKIESVPEYLKMDMIDIQCKNDLKRMFENSESKTEFFFHLCHKRKIFQFKIYGAKSC